METQVEKNLPFEVVGTTVYQLEFDSYRKGVEQMRNRVYANVQGYRNTPVAELALKADARIEELTMKHTAIMKEFSQ